jgi:hypothetical protein
MIVEYGGVQNNTFRRNIFGEQNDENIINSFESDTYCTIYKYDNENIDSCNFIAPLYLDLDIDNIEEDYNKLIRDLKILIHKLVTEFHVEQNDIQIYFSGSKGFHLIISENIFGFEPGRTLNKDLKKVAVYLKAYTLTKCIDTKIYDYKRLFRINNTINSKTGLYKVRISYDDLIDMSYNDLIEYASKPKDIEPDEYLYNDKANESFANLIEKLNKRDREKINIQVAKEYIKKKELLPCVKYILQNGSPNGQRNNSTIALANSLFQVGYNQDEVIEIITTWNETKNEEPLPDREIRATIKSAYNNSKQNIYYGCSSFRELDVCVKGCPIYKR